MLDDKSLAGMLMTITVMLDERSLMIMLSDEFDSHAVGGLTVMLDDTSLTVMLETRTAMHNDMSLTVIADDRNSSHAVRRSLRVRLMTIAVMLITSHA